MKSPTTPTTKDNQVYLGIRGRIMGLVYRPGEHLREEELCREYSVTRTPVRLALRRLEHERLVVNEPFRGVYVRQVEPAELRSLFDIREVLEGLAARNVAVAADVAVLGTLARLARTADAAGARSQWIDYFAHDRAFHNELIKHSGNPNLIELMEIYDFHLRTFAFYDRFQGHVITQLQEIAPQLVDQHALMVEALESGNGDRAEAAFRAHVRLAKTISDTACREWEAARA